MVDLTAVADFARGIHAGNVDGHGFEHIERVVALARRILATEPAADAELVLTACYLHDTYDEKICQDVAVQKAAVADFLLSVKFDRNKIEQIFDMIDKMSFSSNLTEKQVLDLNGQIVQDADRLDAMGAWGIVRTLEYGKAHNREFYNPQIPPVKFDSKADYHQANGTTLNHFYEKLFLLKDLLNTTEARKMGAARHQIMQDFVAAIEREYHDAH